MSQRSRGWTLGLLLLLLISFNPAKCFKCRTEDGPSDAELKRVTRSCMRKIGENARFGNGGGTSSSSSSSSINSGSSATSHGGASYHNRYGQQHQTNYGQQQSNLNYDYKDDGNYNDSSNDNYNYNSDNYNGGNYERSDDLLRQRNRNRAPMNRAGSRPSSNNDRGRFELANNGGRSGNSGAAYGDNSGGNQRSSMQTAGGGFNSNHGGSNFGGNTNNSNHSSGENTCVVHCFFEEMNMLNSDDLPDKHKVKYMLTKDLRDRELRNFYTDTIQECFHYLESQRRRDKCHYSRELISCMTEYAKANCEDWQEYNMMFN